MSMIRKALKDEVVLFSKWIKTVSRSRHKRIWNAYQIALKKWNDEHEFVNVWVQKHIDDKPALFHAGYAKQQAKLKRLKMKVQTRLAKVIVAFRKDMAGK